MSLVGSIGLSYVYPDGAGAQILVALEDLLSDDFTVFTSQTPDACARRC